MNNDLELLIRPTVTAVFEEYELDEDDDCDAALYSQGYNSMPLNVEPNETFQISAGFEATIMTECIVNFKGEDRCSCDEFDSLSAGTYYFDGKEIRKGIYK